MKTIIALIFLGILTIASPSIACSGCSKSKSGNMAANIQSTLGTPTNGLSGARIIGSTGQTKAFKDSKIFDSVGKDQGEEDPDWKSSIPQ